LIAGLFIPDDSPAESAEDAQASVDSIAPGLRGFLEAAGADHSHVVALFDGLLMAIVHGLEAGWTPLPPVIPPKRNSAKERLECVRQALVRVGKTVPGFNAKADLPDQVVQLGQEIKRLR
jgi:hypothetical protein